MSESALSPDRTTLLTQQLTELLQEGSAEAFLREVASRSDASADAHWDVLAAVERLYKSRKLSPQLFRLARMGIERRALGFKEQSSSPSERDLQRMRGELARAQLEAAAQRERAQRLERELEQTASQRPQLPSSAAGSKAASPRMASPRAAAPAVTAEQPDAPKLAAAGPAEIRQGTKRSPLRARHWMIAGGAALAVMAMVEAALWMHARRAEALLAAERAAAAAATAAQPAAVPAASAAAASGELAFDTDRYVVDPEQQQLVITVRRTAGTAGELGAEWRALNGGARAGRDFLVPATASLTFQDGQDSAQLVIPILSNPARKHTEFFDLQLIRGSGGATLGKQRRTTIFLLPGAGGPRPPAVARAGG